MNLTELTLERAISEGSTLPYAYVRSLSSVTLGHISSLPPLDEILEARFFGPEKEIRLSDDGSGLHAVEISDGSAPAYIDRACKLLPGFGAKLFKRNYVEMDGDGQGKIVCTRLLRWEE